MTSSDSLIARLPAVAGPVPATPDPVLSGGESRPAWTFVERVAFRFVFIYFGLYTLELWASYFTPSMLRTRIPGAWVSNPVFHYLVDVPARWMGSNMLEICPKPGQRISGTYCWASVGIWLLLVAGVGATVWSLLDRRRLEYRRLNEWMRVNLRYFLAFAMWLYGSAKFDKSQFLTGVGVGEFSFELGNWTMQRIMWGTMGESFVYSMFTGVGEVSGLLMLWRRTTSLGAMITVSVMGTVFVLDLMTRVNIMERAWWYMLMALVLLAPEARRLINLYLRNQPVPPEPPHVPLMRRPAWVPRHTASILKVLLISGILARPFFLRSAVPLGAPFWNPHPLSAAYRVERFVRNGDTIPARYDDSTRWHMVAMPNVQMRGAYKMPDGLDVIAADNSVHSFSITVDSVKGTFTFIKHGSRPFVDSTRKDSVGKGVKRTDTAKSALSRKAGTAKRDSMIPTRDTIGVMSYRWESKDELSLSGTLEKKTLSVLLRKVKERDAALRGADPPKKN